MHTTAAISTAAKADILAGRAPRLHMPAPTPTRAAAKPKATSTAGLIARMLIGGAIAGTLSYLGLVGGVSHLTEPTHHHGAAAHATSARGSV